MAAKKKSDKAANPIKWRGSFGDEKTGQDKAKPITYVSGVPTRDLTLLEFQQLEPALRSLVVVSHLYEATGDAVGAFNLELRPDTQVVVTASSSGAQDSTGSNS